MKLHIMKEGETLGLLSQRYGISWQQICDYNNNLAYLESIPAGTKVKIPTANLVEVADHPIIETRVSEQIPFSYPLPQWSRVLGANTYSPTYSPTYTFYPTQMPATSCNCAETRSQTLRSPLPYAIPLVTQARANLNQMGGADAVSNPMEVVNSPVFTDSPNSETPLNEDEQVKIDDMPIHVSKSQRLIRKNRRVSRAEQVRKLIKRSHKPPPLARQGHSIPWIRD